VPNNCLLCIKLCAEQELPTLYLINLVTHNTGKTLQKYMRLGVLDYFVESALVDLVIHAAYYDKWFCGCVTSAMK